MGAWAAARCEQAGCRAIARCRALRRRWTERRGRRGAEAGAKPRSPTASPGALAAAGRALIEARALKRLANREQALTAAARFDGPIQELEAHGRRRAAARLFAAQARIDRADFLAACGARLREPMLLRMSIDGAKAALKQAGPGLRAAELGAGRGPALERRGGAGRPRSRHRRHRRGRERPGRRAGDPQPRR